MFDLDPDKFTLADAQRLQYLLQPELVHIRESIEKLRPRQRLAMALCACERLYPGYKSYANSMGVQDIMRGILDRLWLHVQGTDVTPAELDRFGELSNSATFGDDDTDLKFQAVVALGCMDFALAACRDGDAHSVVMACQCCRDTIGAKLDAKYAKDYGGLIESHQIPGYIAKINSDPEMVRECEIETKQFHILLEYEVITPEVIEKLLAV